MMAMRALGGAILLACASTVAIAQISNTSPPASRTPGGSALERIVRLANEWDANKDQIYTCDEWKKFVNDLFTKADRNRDGFVDAQEFTTIRDSTAQFKDASLGYFDDNRDGKISRAEFVDKPNPFFLQLDLDRDCRVTLEEIMAAAARQAPRPPSARPEGGTYR